MGWRFRRTLRLAPGLRVNLAKSGASLSFGSAPFTVNVGKRGVYRTVSIPGSGFSHRSRIDSSRAPGADAATAEHAERAVSTVEIGPNGAAAEINARIRQWVWWPVAAAGAFAALLFGGYALLAALALAGLSAYLWKVERARRTTRLEYELEGEMAQRAELVRTLASRIRSARAIWIVDTTHRSRDVKYTAGANTIVKRTKMPNLFANPPFVSTNAPVASMTARRARFYFLPDRILIYTWRRYAFLDYTQLHISDGDTRFVEAHPPGDAPIVGETWQYVNKSGGPDRRFKNNRRYAVVRYGELCLELPGVDLTLQVSNPTVSGDSAGILRLLSELSAR